MTIPLIISICVLLLLAYFFDLTSAKTKIPSVVSLLIIGWFVKQLADFLEISVPDLTPVLPVLGTIGLILIVLEGSFELELKKSKLTFIGKASIIALVPMILLSVLLAFAFQYFGSSGFKIGLANAIPFAIISSAIAIPTAHNLITSKREFITYESSLSDIFGVIFFNFITLNDNIGTQSFGKFILELILILVITFVSAILLAYLLSKIKHHVKFVPIILMIVLIYTISKIYHLPALIFILLFGLFLGNLDEFKSNKYIQKLKPDILNAEVFRLKSLTGEITFLIRSLFFMLFGYLLKVDELLNTETMLWSICITVFIFLLRYLFLKLFKMPISPLLFIAPRGLITILLFLSIPVHLKMDIADNSLITQVIILTAFIMMFGLMMSKSTKKVEN